MAYRDILILLAVLLLGFGLGWWLGSLCEPAETIREEVRYVELPPITKVVEKPIPIREEVIVRDTIREEVAVVMPADTASIVADYLKRRTYHLDFSSDTTGIYKVRAIVEANQLTHASATIQPLQREVENTVVKVRTFRPFVGGGVAIGNNVGASLEVGAVIKEHHLPKVGYQRIGSQDYITIGYGYIFGR